MSSAAILKAARDAIRTALSKDFQFVGVRPEGRPPPMFGPWFIALDEASVDSTEHTCLREVYAIEATITVRTGIFPQDRMDEAYLNSLFGLDPLERAVLTALHGVQDVRVAANVFAAAIATNYYPFDTPLFYTGRARSSTKGSEWNGDQREDSTFMTRVLPFGGAIRIQALGSIT